MSEPGSMERLAARVVDEEPIDWLAAERACATDEERGWVRNLHLLSDIARQTASLEIEGPALPTLTLGGVKEGASAPPSTSAGPRAGLNAGSYWGPLEIIERVGHGGFADVYKARDTRLNRLVALKLVRDGANAGACSLDQEERALADGRAMARVRHPNVATVHGAERIDGRVGIWMDYIDGQTLEELISFLGPLGSREAAGIGIELCGALAAVHNAGLVHCDVKAQNVLKEKGGRIVLMDFGAARPLGPDDVESRVLGTPLYLPPEVFQGQAMSIAGDIYALGVLLHHLVTRSFPVKASSLDELRRAHERGEMTSLRDERPDLSGAFVQVVEKALAREAADRFGTMGQMQLALEMAIQVTGPRRAVTVPEPPAPVRRVATLSSYAAVSLAALLLASWVLWHRRRPVENIGTVSAPTEQQEAQAAPSGRYSISAALYRSGDAGQERLVTGARIKVGDRLHMELEASQPVHVYVLSHDLAGDTFTLFPRPDCDLKNPLPPGRHRLPGRRIRDGLQLDWQVDSAGGREQVLIVAGLTPISFVEEAIARLPAGRQHAALSPDAAIRLRGIGGVIPQPSDTIPPDAPRLFEDVKRLVDSAEQASGTWMRQIELENPPSR